ncbi:ubiquinone biosynthesis protein UbiJ [Chitinivorax tropicus]|uniref:Ubiquinone biosynthesis accessory factor UbiJ n=1 Tax=Chitinivorax tropicus TaxID=714531 RepID=A0A840MV90_9PROT|nr:sterol-binding protein [Chitinivorax tropicus]MBB5020266.1 ubiquinone biosynthesis protein UbiJ [Chitinivorax tropicus]
MLLAPFNHLLAQQVGLRNQMAEHAGQVVVLVASPIELCFKVAEDGFLQQATPPADTTLRFHISLLPRLALKDEAAYRDIVVEGDTALGAEIGKLLKGLRWDAEEDLSRLVGDVLAHRLTQWGAGLFGPQGEFAFRLARQYTEHWTEEAPLLAKQHDVASFLAAVDVIRDDVDRAEKRLERLTALLKPPAER